ncbi:MAG: hypothetical protein IJ048_01175 [Clostridia bacterium]|nr:hypothetical protein [Clostridia bacterium]
MDFFRRIDQIVLWLLVLAILFTGIMALTNGRIIPSGMAAAALCLGLRRLFSAVQDRLKGRTRGARRRYAQHFLDQWAMLPEEGSKREITALLSRRHWLAADERLVVLALSPASTAFDADAVYAAWQRNRNETRLCLAALCAAQPQAQQWAEKLHQPSLRLADRKTLLALIVDETPVVPASFHPKRQRISVAELLGRIVRQIKPVKAAFYAALMLGLYALNGSAAHLAAFGLFFALTVLGLRRRICESA